MRLGLSTLILASLLAATACDKGKGTSDGKEDPPATDGATGPACDTSAGKVVVDGECKDGEEKAEEKKDDGLALEGGTLDVALVPADEAALSTALVGQAGVAELKSLEYRFLSIQICEKMEVNGTGFNNPENCLLIYDGQVDQSAYGDLPPKKSDKNSDGQLKYPSQNEFDVAVAAYEAQVQARHTAALADTKYINLRDPTSVKKLSAQLKLTDKDAHAYSFGLVSWYRPIRVKASAALIGASPAKTVYTKDGPAAIEVVGMDSYLKHVTNAASDMTAGPAEVAVIEHPNGGSWFNFPMPFVITTDDLKAKKNFKLKLTFNPHAVVKAFDDQNQGQLKDTTNDVSISIPMLHLTPIAHAADKVILKETYSLEHIPGGADEPFFARVELYSIKGDAAKTVYGVDSQILYKTGSTTMVSDLPQAFFLKQTATNVSLKDYQSKGDDKPAFLTIPRLTAAGASSTAKVKSVCVDGHPGFRLPKYMGVDCSQPANTNFIAEDDVTVTLDSITELK